MTVLLARDMPVHTVYNVMYEFMYMYRPYSNDINVTVTIGPTMPYLHDIVSAAITSTIILQLHFGIHNSLIAAPSPAPPHSSPGRRHRTTP